VRQWRPRPGALSTKSMARVMLTGVGAKSEEASGSGIGQVLSVLQAECAWDQPTSIRT